MKRPLDPARFQAVLAAARSYAVDVSLVNYCLRVYDEQRPFLYYAEHRDIEDALARLKAANSEPRQNAEFVQAVLVNVRFYAKDAQDPALDRRCIEGEVEKNHARLFGLGVPLAMTSRWANAAEVGSSIAFEALQSALSVSLIATPRAALKTCRADEVVSAVVESNKEQFGYIPVVANSDPTGGAIVGMFHAEAFRKRRCDDLIAQHMEPLSEDHLVGAATSILEFIVDADSRPSRLVVFGGGFLGLVTISDLQKLPVRSALFAAITSFEMTMSEVIRRRFSSDDEWMALLSDGRKEKIREAIEISRSANGFVDALLFTQFCDKGDIIRKSLPLPHSAETLKSKFYGLQKLRNHLAHANDYASTPMEVKQLCGLLGDLLSLRTQIVAASQ